MAHSVPSGIASAGTGGELNFVPLTAEIAVQIPTRRVDRASGIRGRRPGWDTSREREGHKASGRR